MKRSKKRLLEKLAAEYNLEVYNKVMEDNPFADLSALEYPNEEEMDEEIAE